MRCFEIPDYSTYYQPVVMRDIFGFGSPLDDVPMLFQPGILSMAWGSVVRQIAAGLDVDLDEPLVEKVERVPATETSTSSSVHIAKGTAAAVRFEVRGTVDGVPPRGARARHPHPPRPDARLAAARAATAATASRSPASRMTVDLPTTASTATTTPPG